MRDSNGGTQKPSGPVSRLGPPVSKPVRRGPPPKPVAHAPVRRGPSANASPAAKGPAPQPAPAPLPEQAAQPAQPVVRAGSRPTPARTTRTRRG